MNLGILMHLGRSIFGIFEILNNYDTSWKITILETPQHTDSQACTRPTSSSCFPSCGPIGIQHLMFGVFVLLCGCCAMGHGLGVSLPTLTWADIEYPLICQLLPLTGKWIQWGSPAALRHFLGHDLACQRPGTGISSKRPARLVSPAIGNKLLVNEGMN